jgi:hypothetical protein
MPVALPECLQFGRSETGTSFRRDQEDLLAGNVQKNESSSSWSEIEVAGIEDALTAIDTFMS